MRTTKHASTPLFGPFWRHREQAHPRIQHGSSLFLDAVRRLTTREFLTLKREPVRGTLKIGSGRSSAGSETFALISVPRFGVDGLKARAPVHARSGWASEFLVRIAVQAWGKGLRSTGVPPPRRRDGAPHDMIAGVVHICSTWMRKLVEHSSLHQISCPGDNQDMSAQSQTMLPDRTHHISLSRPLLDQKSMVEGPNRAHPLIRPFHQSHHKRNQPRDYVPNTRSKSHYR